MAIIQAKKPFQRLKSPATYDAGALDKQFINVQQSLQQVRYPTVTSAYTLKVVDIAVFADASGGAFAVTLPAPDRVAGLAASIKNVGGAGTVTVVGTVDGVVDPTLAPLDGMTVMSDGTSWWILSRT